MSTWECEEPILRNVWFEKQILKLADSRPVKTIKKEKYRLHYFVACTAEVTCIVTTIKLENMFCNIKSSIFTYGGKRNSAVELACLQMLNIASVRYLFTHLLYLSLNNPSVN